MLNQEEKYKVGEKWVDLRLDLRLQGEVGLLFDEAVKEVMAEKVRLLKDSEAGKKLFKKPYYRAAMNTVQSNMDDWLGRVVLRENLYG